MMKPSLNEWRMSNKVGEAIRYESPSNPSADMTEEDQEPPFVPDHVWVREPAPTPQGWHWALYRFQPPS